MLPRRLLDHRGVSEVIGTILILLITVILFSTIVVWVFTLPTPRAASNVGIEGVLEWHDVDGDGDGAYVNLTHLGGDDLLDTNTRIYLTIDDQTHTLRTRGWNIDDDNSTKPYGVNGPDVHWNIGETWSYVNETIKRTARISVLVVDVVRGTVVWDQVLLGEDGKRMPVFLEKWVDSVPSSPSRDPVGVGDTFAIYARVGDPDGDLNSSSVSAFITFGDDFPLGPRGPFPLVDNGDGIFSRALSFAALRSWDGGIIILSATDMGGREAQTRLLLHVVDTGTSSQVTGPSSLNFGSDVQRYDIFEAEDWEANGWEATSTRDFIKNQSLVVVVATKTIPNPDLKNTFILWDPYDDTEVVYSNASYTNPVTDTSIPSTTQAFGLTEFISGFYIYEYRFSTTSAGHGFDGYQLQPGHYPLEFELITSLTPSPNNRLYVTDSIRVTDLSGNSLDYPKVETYKDADHTQPNSSFNFAEIMYVKIVVKSTGDFDIGEVIVSDFVGNIPIWASPGTTPVSVAVGNDTVSYSFSVDLSKPNIDPWNFGTVSYNLEIRNIQDADENYSRISGQIKVTGPRWKLDITIGLKSTEHRVFDLTIYGDFFDNAEGWTEYPFETFSPSPGNNKALDHRIMSQVLGDLDGDGDLDILVGTESGDVWWYRNGDGKAHSMSRFTIAKLNPWVTSVALGHVDADSDLDAAVGTSTGEVWWYRNDGSWSANLVDNVGTGVAALRLADVNGDGAADLIVGLDSGSSSVRVYLNNGRGVFGEVHTTTVLMAADVASPGHGGTGEGAWKDTQSSNDAYQRVDEVATNLSLVNGEQTGTAETVQGSYLYTQEDDDVFHQNLTEGEEPISLGTAYTLGSPGHRYLFPNLTAASSDTLEVHLLGYIRSGSEAFKAGWSKDGSLVEWFIGEITSTTEAEYIWSLTGETWSDETLYLHILDTDQSHKDGSSDGQISILSIDHLYLLQPGSGTTSSLVKVWISDPIPSWKEAYKLFVEGYHTLNNEGDDFNFKYALNSPHGPYFDLIKIAKPADDDTNQSISLPTSVGGNILYVMVQDMDRSDGSSFLDSLWVDYLAIRTYESIAAHTSINVGGGTTTLSVADFDRDGNQDIAVARTNDNIRVVYGDGTGTRWPVQDSFRATGDLRTLGIGDMNGDSDLDLVVGTTGGDILLFTNGGSRGVWPLSFIWVLSTDETSTLRVGDVDGDGWDDVVFGTELGYLIYLRNEQGKGWLQTIIIRMNNDPIDSVDIGDADRGVIIRTHPY